MSAIPHLTTRPAAWPRLTASGGAVAGVLAIAHVSNDALTSMLTALLPSLQVRLGLSEAALALLVATLAFSSSVVQPLFGALSDRYGARRVAAAGTALGVSIMSLITVAPTLPVLVGLLLIGGLGSAAFHPAGTSAVGAASLRRKELAVSLFSAGGTVGLAVGPVIVLAATATFGLSFTPWLIVPALGLGALMLVVLPDGPGPTRPGSTRLVERGLIAGPVGVLALAATMSGLAFVAFNSGYPLYLVREHGVATHDPVLGVTLAVFNLGAAGGAVAAAALSGRLGRSALATASTVASLLPLTALLSLGPASPLYLPAVAAAGGLLNASLPLLLVAAHELVPRSKATASGMLLGLPVGLAGLLYVLVGLAQTSFGVRTGLAMAFASVIPAALLMLAALRRRTGDSTHLPRACGCIAARPCSWAILEREASARG